MKIATFFLIVLMISCQAKLKDTKIDSFLDLNGNKIHYTVAGEGKALTFIHGGYLDLSMWDAQVDSFKPTHQVLRFSDLGHGKTETVDASLLGREIVDALLLENDIKNTTLIGLSWGSMLAVDFALEYPEKVEKLVLVSPGLNGWDYFQDTLALRNYNLRQEAIANNDTTLAAQLFHQNWVLGPRRAKLQVNAMFYTKSLKMITENMKNHWLEDWSSLDSVQAIHRLEDIKVPTSIIIGDQDAEDIKLIADIYNERIPNSEKIILRKVGHLLPMEDPEVFYATLKKILEE